MNTINSHFERSFAKSKGGVIHAKVSSNENSFIFNNTKFKNTFSLEGSILSIPFRNYDYSDVRFENSEIKQEK